MKKLGSIIAICCLLVMVSMINASCSCQKKVVQTPTTPPVTDNTAVTPSGTEPESIMALQGIALKAFDDQMQAYFAESPDKDAKIKVFEEVMDKLAQEYYRYYVEETKEGIEAGKTKFTTFLTNFKSADGVGLTKDSIPFYLEKMKKK